MTAHTRGAPKGSGAVPIKTLVFVYRAHVERDRDMTSIGHDLRVSSGQARRLFDRYMIEYASPTQVRRCYDDGKIRRDHEAMTKLLNLDGSIEEAARRIEDNEFALAMLRRAHGSPEQVASLRPAPGAFRFPDLSPMPRPAPTSMGDPPPDYLARRAQAEARGR